MAEGSSMRSITELHHHAMALADKGDAARAQSNPALARERFEQAFLLEQQALTLTPPDVQPTYAVLLRSVASLALEAERPGDALKHIKLGLENASTPDLIRAELEELLARTDRADGEGARSERQESSPSASTNVSRAGR